MQHFKLYIIYRHNNDVLFTAIIRRLTDTMEISASFVLINF